MKKKFEGLFGRTNKLVNKITSVKFIVTVGVVLLVGICFAWKYHNTTDPDRVFWGMVDNNLKTSAYTRHAKQKSGSQSVDQVLQTQIEPKQIVYSETVFSQTGVDSAKAVTENIGTPTHDYVRYTSIETAQKGADGKPLDFSKVINKWGVTQPDDPTQTTGQLFNQAVLGVIPTGNLTLTQRQQLLDTMRNQGAYKYTVTETTRTWPFGRPTYKYNVSVKPVAYITALQQFAADIGLNHLEGINPNDYASAQELAFSVTVDGWSHQMTSGTQSQGAREEIISGRGLKKAMPAVPTETISVDELQGILQSIR